MSCVLGLCLFAVGSSCPQAEDICHAQQRVPLCWGLIAARVHDARLFLEASDLHRYWFWGCTVAVFGF